MFKQDYILIGVDASSRFAIRLLSLGQHMQESLALHKPGESLQKVYQPFLLASLILGSRSDEQEATLFQLSLEESALRLNVEVSPLGVFRSAIFPPEKRNETVTSLKGQLKVVRLKKDKTVYESIVEMDDDGVEAGFLRYLQASDQAQSILRLEWTETGGHALWIDKLPQTSMEDWKDFIKPFEARTLFHETVTRTDDPDQITQALFPQGMRILAVTKPQLNCSCSKERFVAALKNLSAEELAELFLDKNGVTSQCDYCHKVWTVTDDDLKGLLKSTSSVH